MSRKHKISYARGKFWCEAFLVIYQGGELILWFNILTEIILGTKDAIIVAEERAEGPTCYYYVLADHFVHVPQNGKPILDLIVQLWSQSFAANIFSLLFHKWVSRVFTSFNDLTFPFKFCTLYVVRWFSDPQVNDDIIALVLIFSWTFSIDFILFYFLITNFFNWLHHTCFSSFFFYQLMRSLFIFLSWPSIMCFSQYCGLCLNLVIIFVYAVSKWAKSGFTLRNDIPNDFTHFA